jgi:hypothetical protein
MTRFSQNLEIILYYPELSVISLYVRRGEVRTDSNRIHGRAAHNTLRRQDWVRRERRDKRVSDFPLAAALAQVLKDLEFPADNGAIIRFVEQSSRP